MTSQVTSLAHDLAEVKVKIDKSLSHDMIELRKQLKEVQTNTDSNRTKRNDDTSIPTLSHDSSENYPNGNMAHLCSRELSQRERKKKIWPQFQDQQQ